MTEAELRTWIKRSRKLVGLTQQETTQRLAEAGIHIARPALVRLERGTRGIGWDEGQALITLLRDQAARAAAEIVGEYQEWL